MLTNKVRRFVQDYVSSSWEFKYLQERVSTLEEELAVLREYLGVRFVDVKAHKKVQPTDA